MKKSNTRFRARTSEKPNTDAINLFCIYPQYARLFEENADAVLLLVHLNNRNMLDESIYVEICKYPPQSDVYQNSHFINLAISFLKKFDINDKDIYRIICENAKYTESISTAFSIEDTISMKPVFD